MANWSYPLRGPFRDINDADLELGPCDFCGESENTAVISRVPCKNCKKIVCWKCADCGVYGSLYDFQNFVHRSSKKGKGVYLLPESCPDCQEISWWEKYSTNKGGSETAFQPPFPTTPPKRVIETKISRYDLEAVQSLRLEAIRVAESILSEKTGIIEGARILAAISYKLDFIEPNTDFLVFVAISSETDHLPVGKERELWAKSALQQKDDEIKQVEDFHKETVFSACRALIEKWGKNK